MNVGYAVIAEFIVQHEDTTSIMEALLILQNAGIRKEFTSGTS